jgi:hypothetical protein
MKTLYNAKNKAEDAAFYAYENVGKPMKDTVGNVANYAYESVGKPVYDKVGYFYDFFFIICFIAPQ